MMPSSTQDSCFAHVCTQVESEAWPEHAAALLNPFVFGVMLSLVFEILKLFAEGALPATVCQRLAAAAWRDGWGQGDEAAQSLKGAGNSGRHPGNAQRDVLRLARRMGISENTPEPYYVDVRSVGGANRQVGVCLRHEQLQSIVAEVGLDAVRLSEEVWEDAEGMGPLLRGWGDSDDVLVDSRDVVILGMHADGVSYTSSVRAGGSKAVLVASWNIASAPLQAQRARRFLFFVLSKALGCDCGCEGWHTFDPLFRVFAWSMQCLKE